VRERSEQQRQSARGQRGTHRQPFTVHGLVSFT
jgi:hypothetical protein